MGRELRKVPAGWEHPKDENGRYIPMYGQYYGDVIKEWLEGHKQWEDGTHPELVERPETKERYPFFAMWDGRSPDPDMYHIRKYAPEELTHIQLYETTSEGTPVSPVFKAGEIEELCGWAAENCTTFGRSKATKEQWLAMLSDGLVCHKEGNLLFI